MGSRGGGITIVFHCLAYVAVAEGGSVVTQPAVTRLYKKDKDRRTI